jgi:hypothetical protein
MMKSQKMMEETLAKMVVTAAAAAVMLKEALDVRIFSEG